MSERRDRCFVGEKCLTGADADRVARTPVERTYRLSEARKDGIRARVINVSFEDIVRLADGVCRGGLLIRDDCFAIGSWADASGIEGGQEILALVHAWEDDELGFAGLDDLRDLVFRFFLGGELATGRWCLPAPVGITIYDPRFSEGSVGN